MREDNNVISSSQLLDLILEDATSRENAESIAADKIKKTVGVSVQSESFIARSDRDNQFRVRLSHPINASLLASSDEEEEEDQVTELGAYRKDDRNLNRRKMAISGGYGGMFDPGVGQLRSDSSHCSSDDEQTTSTGRDGSSIGSVFSLASVFFSGERQESTKKNRGANQKRYKNYASFTKEDALHLIQKFLLQLYESMQKMSIDLSLRYLRLPFQMRYFIQLFSIIGVFLLAFLNYFIAMDDVNSSQYSNAHKILEGGGASSNIIPRLHVNSPFQYLHSNTNQLFERAMTKLQKSTRIGNSSNGGPFTYGWKSMPPQIFIEFDSSQRYNDETIAQHNNKIGALEKIFPPKGTVAYVLPVTTCYPPRHASLSESVADSPTTNFYPYSINHPQDADSFRDFAIMLRAMVHAHSYQNTASGSMYDYKMHAVVSPMAKMCVDDQGVRENRWSVLQHLGYEVSLNRPKLNLENIESEYLKNYLLKHGGENMENLSDLVRLNAYELEEYDAVILVDYDTLILGAVDEAIDLITDNSNRKGKSVDAVYSWKHIPSLVNPHAQASVVNLSFFILRPSKETLNKIRRAYKEATFSEGRGWGNIGRGRFAGWMTTQGILTYYYEEIENAAKVEMNRCAFGNTGVASSSQLITNEGIVDCSSNERLIMAQCDDCSKSKFKNILVADFSDCTAPWKCGVGDASSLAKLPTGLCRSFQRQWFSGRLQMEDAHPQLEKGNGNICIDGHYQAMKLTEE